MLYLDFDDNAYEGATKFRHFCEKHHYKYYTQMSGRGYNCFLFTSQTNLKNPKNAVGNAQEFVCKAIGIPCDKKVVSDVVRICRVPRTFNWARGRMCIPVSNEDLDKGDEYIKNMATPKSESKEAYQAARNLGVSGMYSGDLLDLTPFDTNERKYEVSYLEGPEVEMSPENVGFNFENFPPCIRKLMRYPELGYDGRCQVILWCRDYGYLQKETIELLKRFLTPAKFAHAIKKSNETRYIYGKSGLWLSRCENLQRGGLCELTSYNECKKRIY
jgi:hypothetical protein